MCGIAGVYSLGEGLAPPEIDTLTTMIGALRHRGPDEFGVYRDHRAGLAHARLSIVDLSTGQQPMSNEDGTLWIVFNGEIFNFIELRAELLAQGHQFRTKSDTEVIVHAYEEWGPACFERFNGQWAVALWDAARHELVLSRDRLGVRPLYLCEHERRLYFASEVKAIFAANPAIPRALDPIGLEQTFTFWTVVPPQSVFQGIEELRPGHTRIYRDGHVRDICFWGAQYPLEETGAGRAGEFRGSPADAAAAVRDALEQAISLRILRADVPVGSYLSGGLDSSLVAALGLRAKQEKFHTYSIRFEDAEYDETQYQRAMVKAIDSDHREVVVSRKDIAECFPHVVAQTERPILRTAPAPLYLLSRAVRQSGVKVVLTGEGADEMFAGYDLFREARIRRFWARRPDSEMRPRLLSRLYPYLSRSPVAQQAMAREFFGANLAGWQSPGFSHGPRWRTTGALKRLFRPELRAAIAASDRPDVVDELLGQLPADFNRWSPLAQDQYLEVRTLLSGYLLSSQGDRMLMAHSVEGRFPFLDANVVALANSLPASYKLRGLSEKHVLKQASEGLVPPAIIARKKQPYRAPDALSFVAEDAPEWIAEVLSPAAVRDAGVFAPRAIEQLWAKLRGRRESGQYSNSDNMAIVGVLSTQLLFRQFIDATPEQVQPDELTTVVDTLTLAGSQSTTGAGHRAR